MVRALNRKPLVVFGDGNQTRDFLYVEDAAQALVAVARCSGVVGECINFCSGIETTVRRIAELVCTNFDLDPGEMIERQAERPGDVARHLGDNGKFQRLLRFEPQTSVEEGIRKTAAWIRSLPHSPEELLAQEQLRNWE